MNLPKLCTLADYTKPEFIIPQLTTRTTTSVMQELTTALRREDGSVPDQLSSSTAALIRELLTSTALDFGAVFPQVRVAALSRPHCCPANGGLIFCNTAGSLWLYIGEDVFD